MTVVDLVHLTGRVPAGHPAEVERQHAVEVAATHEDMAVRLLAQAADAGAVRRQVHELEHGLGPVRVDPWRLVARLAELQRTGGT